MDSKISTEESRIQEEFGFALIRLARRWRMRLDRQMKTEGLTESQWNTLVYLARGGNGKLQKDLANSIGIEGPTLVRLLDNLEEKGLVERRASATDRRGKTVHLGADTSLLLENFSNTALTLRAQLLRGVPAESLQQCLDVFDLIIENARSLEKT
ncbi:MAG: MarR family transcriptional regulator [Pseudomonadales bacterium]|nr:MarR family transcriptional regulator [Pseudomonadales bacterium]